MAKTEYSFMCQCGHITDITEQVDDVNKEKTTKVIRKINRLKTKWIKEFPFDHSCKKGESSIFPACESCNFETRITNFVSDVIRKLKGD